MHLCSKKYCSFVLYMMFLTQNLTLFNCSRCIGWPPMPRLLESSRSSSGQPSRWAETIVREGSFGQPWYFSQEIDSVAQITQTEVEVLVDVAHTSQVPHISKNWLLRDKNCNFDLTRASPRVVICPNRWSLLLVFGFLCWSYFKSQTTEKHSIAMCYSKNWWF